MERFTELVEDEDKLVKPLTLVVGLIALSVVLISINVGLNQLSPTWRLRQLPVDFVVLGTWVAFWLYKKNQFPKNKQGVGIVIALTTENDKGKVRVRTDLIRKLEQLIVADDLRQWVTVLAFNNHQAKRIIPILEAHAEAVNVFRQGTVNAKLEKKWRRIKKRIKANLYIYGHVTERRDEENAYFLDTNALVVHMPIADAVRKQLSLDFLDVWSHQVTFLEKVEKRGFEFTATYWFTAAQYIIGCAAFAYNDIWTALKLHEAVKNKLGILRFRPTFERTQKRLNGLLGTEHAIIAHAYYVEGDVVRMKEHLAKCLAVDPQNYSGQLQKAISEFMHDKDPRKALRTVEVLSRNGAKDRTWMYSQAFLLMYLERFDKALTVYRRIAKSTYESEIENIVPQIIRFNEQQLIREPNKIQSHFILGYIKLKKNINYPEALSHFETFLNKARRQARYHLVVKEAEVCVQELETTMGV